MTRVVEGEEIIVNKTFSRTLSTEEGTNREVLTTTETEGGASVSVDWSRGTREEADTGTRNTRNTFVSDSGVQITEL